MKTTITKVFRFAYAHRLNNSNLTEEQNKELFGKCGNPYGHGHNGRLLVTIGGPIDRKSGMIINFSELKRIVNEVLDESFDHKNLDQQVPELMDPTIPSTCENTIQVLWDRLIEKLPTLQSLTLYEEDDSYCTLTKEEA